MQVRFSEVSNISSDMVLSPQCPAVSDKVRQPNVYRQSHKRVFDSILVIATAPLWLPLVVVMALLVWSRDGRNPFYYQTRVGMNGRNFRMWKIRSMVADADARLAQYLKGNAEARIEWDRDQKLKNDPRITPLGRILRKTSIDEIPQLWNVLCGEMSLVGPRPMMVSQRALYHGRSYYRLRPGLTGFWQISNRNESRFRDRVRFDDAYEEAVSLQVDIVVLIRTVAVVIRGTGY